MPIYRGDGGSGDSTTDAYASQVAQDAATATEKANEASASATEAANSATAAATSATNAATSETNASSSETNAASSATAAATSATNAATSETNASTSETNAATSATNAATSETNASSSATAAANSATAAATSETNAATSATNAATSETNAATSATNAANSATAAATSATAAATSASDAATSYDNFDDRYLGAKANDPSVDNDGDALITGALYFNSTAGEMRVWDGSAWEAAYLPGSSYLQTSGSTATDLTITSADINGGNIDGTIIGATTPAAATFTTFTSTGIDDNATSTAIAIDSSNNIEVNGNFSSTVSGIDGNGNVSTNIGATISATTNGTVVNNAFIADLIFGTNGGSSSATERMRIDSSGNIGINETAPTARLHVKGDDGLKFVIDSIYAANETLSFTSDNNDFWIVNNLTGTTSGAEGIGFNSANSRMYFKTNGITQMQIDASGVDMSGNLHCGDNTDISMDTSGNGHIQIDGNAYHGAIALDATAMHIYHNSSSRNLVLGTNESARVTIAGNGGNVTFTPLIVGKANTTTTFNSANDSGSISIRSDGTAPAVMSFHRPSAYAVNFGLDGSNMKLGGWSAVSTKFIWEMGNGNFHADGNIIAYSVSTSDERFKDDVQPITGALDTVDALKGVTFTWNAGSRKGKRDYGLIAQEVEKVLPELVHESALPMMTGDEETQYKTLDYEKLCAVLISAVSELRAEVEELRASRN